MCGGGRASQPPAGAGRAGGRPQTTQNDAINQFPAIRNPQAVEQVESGVTAPSEGVSVFEE